ncbi:hypothetical protein BOTNAR_0003g00360 [Botryotinia narcissicola]|uniref:Uncharacterized protein n=1 Tax=Botryotinia narcissicola TaxID=278944 RepID=A0A4Z1JFM5_9HELO|nr:hypothetical protein BOTNAR_0003g00360 [Botryotinia narcissicola]
MFMKSRPMKSLLQFDSLLVKSSASSRIWSKAKSPKVVTKEGTTYSSRKQPQNPMRFQRSLSSSYLTCSRTRARSEQDLAKPNPGTGSKKSAWQSQ